MKSEKEKMISGEIYNPANPRLVLDRARANRICTKYNKKCFNEINMSSRLLKKLINTEEMLSVLEIWALWIIIR